MKNWRTSLAGICGGLIPIISGLTPPINWTNVAIGVVIVILGVLAKDLNQQ